MLNSSLDYENNRQSFNWSIPEHYNIAHDACDKWADGSNKLALIQEDSTGQTQHYSFDQLKTWSDQFASGLQAQGISQGDRVGILLAQGVETAIAHLAVYKIGAIAMPLFSLFGFDALQHRLLDSGARALITNRDGLQKISHIHAQLPELKRIYCIDDNPEQTLSAHDFWQIIHAAKPGQPNKVTTKADDPALLIYTSGTTGSAKGALHAHRVLLGHLPGVEMSHNFLPNNAELMWTPADWAWIGGLLDVLLPAWHHGIPVLAHRFEKFTPEAACDLMAKHGVTHTFLPPTALKSLRHLSNITQTWPLKLRSIASGGESLGTELLHWAQTELGITINEFYGQTECNMIVSSCSAWFPSQQGIMGKAVPGHDVQIIDDKGHILPAGQEGHIAVRRPDPVMFLGYWNQAAATKEKFVGDFLLTGDRGVQDSQGYLRFVGRADDVITSSGYRVGPGPIEDCLLAHPAVALAAVVGVPDAERTEIIKAVLVLKAGHEPSPALIKDIQEHVRSRVAAHEYPRIVEFRSSLPMTTTGKLIRHALRQTESDQQ